MSYVKTPKFASSETSPHGMQEVASSGYGGKLLAWLGERFVELKQDATKAFNGISQALAKGDITLAAQILWLTLKMEFLKGKQVLLEIWLSFKNKFLEYWNGIGYSMVLVWDTTVYGIKIAWIETVAFLKTAWIGFKSVFANVSDWCVKKLMGIYIWWQKLLNPKFDDTPDCIGPKPNPENM